MMLEAGAFCHRHRVKIVSRILVTGVEYAQLDTVFQL
jgi:hypothetical protein